MGRKNAVVRALILVVFFFVAAKLIGGGATLIGALFKLGFTAVAVLAVVIIFSVFIFKKDEKKNKNPQPKAEAEPEPQPEPPRQEETEPQPDLTASERETLEKSRAVLSELREKIAKIKNAEVKTAAEDVCKRIARILKTLRRQPDEIPKARQCLTYYLPTLRDVISRYQTLETAGTLSDGMIEKTLKFLGQVREAMDKQYESLFGNEEMDLSVDMEAMRIALKRDGLL